MRPGLRLIGARSSWLQSARLSILVDRTSHQRQNPPGSVGGGRGLAPRLQRNPKRLHLPGYLGPGSSNAGSAVPMACRIYLLGLRPLEFRLNRVAADMNPWVAAARTRTSPAGLAG
jgi:hypothetical protein